MGLKCEGGTLKPLTATAFLYIVSLYNKPGLGKRATVGNSFGTAHKHETAPHTLC